MGTDGVIVGLCPAFLEADDVGRGVDGGELVADAGEAGGTVRGDVSEAPAV